MTGFIAFLHLFVPLFLMAIALKRYWQASKMHAKATTVQAPADNSQLTREVHIHKASSWKMSAMAAVAVVMLWGNQSGNGLSGLVMASLAAAPFVAMAIYHARCSTEDRRTRPLEGTYYT